MRPVRRARRSLLAAAGSLLILAGLLPAVAAPVASAVSPNVVISQVYGGGGNTGATYTHDFVELFNRGSSSVSLAGWSIQYASATGTGAFGASPTQLTELPPVTLAPGQYFLVQEAAGAGNGVALPTPDHTDQTAIAMAVGAGKVAVVNQTTSLGCNGGSTPCSAAQLAAIVDLVGYGGANFYEGTAPAPTISASLGDFRGNGGCTDTDNNGSDFTAATPAPRNTATTLNPCPVTPALSVNDVSASEGNSGTSTFAFTVSLSGAAPTGGVTFDIATADGTATVGDNDYLARSLTGQTIPAGSSSYIFNVTVNGDIAGEGDETFFVNVTNVTGATVADAQGQGTVINDDSCGLPFTPIYSIQGSGASAAITGNVTIEGVVVGDYEGPQASGLQGFYMQDADGDGNAATSDGIFVFTGDALVGVDDGERVRVTGFARERFNQTTINGSNSNSAAVPTTSIVRCGTAPLPAPSDVTLPVTAVTDFEKYEGMLVRFPQPLVISEYFNYDRFGEVVLALPLDGEERPFTGTARDEPGAQANARTLANTLRRITLDDGLAGQNPATVRHPNGDPFALDNRFRGGDTVTNATGVLGFDFSLYRIQPTTGADYQATNPRPPAPDPVGGTLKVAAMNTLNYFLTADYPSGDPLDNKCGPLQTLECRGWDSDQPTEFQRQRDKLLQALGGLDVDVIGLNELENRPGVDPAADIAQGLSDLDLGPWAAIETGVIGTDAIKVGLIYRTDRVVPVGNFELLTSADDPRFVDTRSRPVLAQTFDEIATGGRITVAVNHLKSKGSACTGDAAAPFPDPDQGDGQGNCPITRELAAQALVDWLQTDPTGSGDRDYLIIGDLNAYTREDPIDAILAGPDDTHNTTDDYTNLIEHYLGEDAYSFVFDGQYGYLDHALASSTLVGQVTGVTEWHINADEPDLLDYDTSFKPPAQDALYESNAYRTSDHDPVIVGLALESVEFAGFGAPVLNPPAVNTAKAGAAIPLRFALGNAEGVDAQFGTPSVYTCSGWPFGGSPAASVDGLGLTIDPLTGEYKFEWKTSKSWANSCRTFEITFDDGTYRTLDVSFK